MVELSMSVPERDLLEFRRVMALLQTQAGKTPEKAVEIGASFVVKALHAASKLSAKLRPVVKNKDPRAGKDNRVDLFGVWRLRQKGGPKWVPIYGTGEFGRIRYLSKKKAIDRRTGIEMDMGAGEFEFPGLMASKKRVIGHRGLAARMWAMASRKIGKGYMPTENDYIGERIAATLLTVQTTGGDDASMRLHNGLSYALKAFRSGGRATVDNAMRRAANNMRKYAERQTGEKFNEMGK
jgi:hypothetical protein